MYIILSWYLLLIWARFTFFISFHIFWVYDQWKRMKLDWALQKIFQIWAIYNIQLHRNQIIEWVLHEFRGVRSDFPCIQFRLWWIQQAAVGWCFVMLVFCNAEIDRYYITIINFSEKALFWAEFDTKFAPDAPFTKIHGSMPWPHASYRHVHMPVARGDAIEEKSTSAPPPNWILLHYC